MIRPTSKLLTGLAGLLALVNAAVAQTTRLDLPDDTKFALQVDFDAMRASTVGAPLLERAKQQLLDELASKSKGKQLTLDKIREILGFDPFEEVRGIVIAASDYEHPEESLIGCVRLRKTAGNLEGLALALPRYAAEDYGGRQIHTAKPDELELAGAVHVDDAGEHTLVLGRKRDSVVQALDALDGKTSSASTKQIMLDADAPRIAAVRVFELPQDMAEREGPMANVSTIVTGATGEVFEVTQGEGQVIIKAAVDASTEKQAEQLEQMVRGLSAMVGLAASSETDDEDLQQINAWVKRLAIAREGAQVTLDLSVPTAEVKKLIDDRFGDGGK